MASSTSKPVFDRRESIRFADEIFCSPPKKIATRRPEDMTVGLRVARFCVPAELCLSSNATGRIGFGARGHAWVKAKLWQHMELQHLEQLNHLRLFNLPIPDQYRPRIHCVKFSSHAPDVGANSGKKAIDMLQPKYCRDKKLNLWVTERLGIIRNDNPEAADVRHWWEFLPKKHAAFVYLEVRCEP